MAFIIGVGLSYTPVGPLQNNSAISADDDGGINELICCSGSEAGNVGVWIAPDGADITNTMHPFNVTVGGSGNPGFLSIRSPHLSHDDQGVYTCQIPDEDGQMQTIHVGIYLCK